MIIKRYFKVELLKILILLYSYMTDSIKIIIENLIKINFLNQSLSSVTNANLDQPALITSMLIILLF